MSPPRLLPVGENAFALVDEGDYHRVAPYRWVLLGGIPCRRVRSAIGGQSLVLLRRQITRALPGQYITPSDGDALNCTRANLLVLSRSDVNRMARKRRGCSTFLRGVSWAAHAGRWRVRLRVGRRMLHFGYFRCLKLASAAFDAAAQDAFGSRIRLNSCPDPFALYPSATRAITARPGRRRRFGA